MNLDEIAIVLSGGSLIVSAFAVILAYRADRRIRPAVKVEANGLPPYTDGEKTTFIFTNVGSGDLVNPEASLRLSWELSMKLPLEWGETTVLSPTNTKEITVRLPDPPKGLLNKIEVSVSGSGIRFPKKEFEVRA